MLQGFTRYRQGSVDYIEVFLQDEDAKYIGSLEVFRKMEPSSDSDGRRMRRDFTGIRITSRSGTKLSCGCIPIPTSISFSAGPFLDIYGKQLYLWEGPEYYLGDRLEYYDLSLDETQGELPMAKYAPVSEMRFVQGKLLFEDSNVAAIFTQGYRWHGVGIPF